jgi:GT2 family glycosyltransferase
MTGPKLTIQIVTWNSAAHLPATLAALKDMPLTLGMVRIIDNGSTDNSVALVQSMLPQADIIRLDRNMGFAHSHNLGFAKCSTEFVVTLDPDVQLNAQGLEEVLAVFENEKVASVQGKLYRLKEEEDDRPVIDSAGIVHTATLNGKERGAGEADTGQFNAPEQILAVTGAFGIYRMAALHNVAFQKTQFFDEDFFAYKEDVDLGWRLQRAGYENWYEPVMVGVHARTLGKRGMLPWFLNPPQAVGRLRSPRTRYSIRNYVWMVIKNISWRQEIVCGLPIALRLLFIFIATVIFFPLFPVWFEIVERIPLMIHKRHAE